MQRNGYEAKSVVSASLRRYLVVCRPGVGSRDRFAGLLITAGSGSCCCWCSTALESLRLIGRRDFFVCATEQCGIESVLVHDGVFM